MLRTNLTLTIPAASAGMQIIQYLKQFGFSTHLLLQLKLREHSVLLNGQPSYLNVPLKEGDVLHILLPQEESPEKLVPTDIPFGILYEDEDILVVNKPAFLPIHPSRGNFDHTLANAAAYYYKTHGEPFSYRCINRLDRDTTGALILARHALSACILSGEMRERRIHRTYLALVEGRTDPTGTIDLPIGRKNASIIERCIDPEHGERAVTHYVTLKHFSYKNDKIFLSYSPDNDLHPDDDTPSDSNDEYGIDSKCSLAECSLVELHLETGRTHQIRVHMTAIGHPLLGDSLYNPNGISAPGRQALHSSSLAFMHPVTKEMMRIEAPLPDDFLSFFTCNHSVMCSVSPE